MSVNHEHISIGASVSKRNCKKYLKITSARTIFKFINLRLVKMSSLEWHQRSWVLLNASVSPMYKTLYSVSAIPFPWKIISAFRRREHVVKTLQKTFYQLLDHLGILRIIEFEWFHSDRTAVRPGQVVTHLLKFILKSTLENILAGTLDREKHAKLQLRTSLNLIDKNATLDMLCM
jgi:hypothetical protein